MADLVTLSEVKSVLGKDPMDTRDDSKITALIPMVSDAIRAFTERDFGSPVVTEAREFEYDGSGWLDIDDATDVTEVAFIIPGSPTIVLRSETYSLQPARRDDSPIFSYIRMPAGNIWGISPQMGFTYNLDNYDKYGMWSSTVRVTGTWGWAGIPSGVKLAAIWTLQEWASKAAAEGLTSEAIESYSRAWGSKSTGGVSTALAIPNRARDLLAMYQKIDA